MAKDRKPENGVTRGTASRAGNASRAGGARGGKGGRTRPPTQVVAQQRPWGLIIAAVVVVVFAAAAIGYALVQVNKANADKIKSADEIKGLQSFDYAAGQEHVTTPVDYKESPPVGGPHDPSWADCTGSVYKVDIRHENAVHALEHGAVWITYNPDQVSGADVDKLAKLVDGESYRLMSPYKGLDSAISLQSWNHQLKVKSADDARIKQFADFFTQNADVEGHYPEIGASCENPAFLASPLVAGEASAPVGSTDMPTTPTPGASSSATP